MNGIDGKNVNEGKKEKEEKIFIADSEGKLSGIGNKVIDDESMSCISESTARIKYIFVHPEISRTIHARVMRASAELRHFGEFDYLVEFSKKIWDSISPETQYKLMHHELLHVFPTVDKKGKPIFKLINHDVNDFYTLIKRHGVDWFTEYKDMVAQTYEMGPEEKDNISI